MPNRQSQYWILIRVLNGLAAPASALRLQWADAGTDSSHSETCELSSFTTGSTGVAVGEGGLLCGGWNCISLSKA